MGFTEADLSLDKVRAHFGAGDRFGMVGFGGRVGFTKFITRLEHEHYNPKNPALNDRYQIFIISHGGLRFWIISIPLEDRHLAEKIAAECDLRFADGVPAVFGGEGNPSFPIQHKNIWSCENLPGSGVYTGKMAELAAEEQRWLKDFWTKKDAEDVY